jgi:hypothetical protein
MIGPIAGRSAGAPLNAELDPMGRSDEENRRLASDDRSSVEIEGPNDPTPGRSPELRSQDPTRAVRRPPRG